MRSGEVPAHREPRLLSGDGLRVASERRPSPEVTPTPMFCRPRGLAHAVLVPVTDREIEARSILLRRVSGSHREGEGRGRRPFASSTSASQSAGDEPRTQDSEGNEWAIAVGAAGAGFPSSRKSGVLRYQKLVAVGAFSLFVATRAPPVERYM